VAELSPLIDEAAAALEPRFIGAERLAASVVGRSAKDAAIIPLLALGRCTGVLVLALSGPSRPLKDRMLLTAIGQHVGLSLENLRQREELRTGQERTRALLDAIPDTMVRASRDGTITAYKERETGSTSSSRSAATLRPPARTRIGGARRMIGAVLDSGEPQTFEFELTGPMALAFARLAVRGGPDELVAIIRDITESKMAEGRPPSERRALPCTDREHERPRLRNRR
jgi:PAS domain-containing protein